MKKGPEFIKGFVDTLPVGISVALYGVVYGVLSQKTGLSAWTVAAMSLLVFAGASQIAAVQMIAQGCNPISVIFTVFIINLRHYLMAASVSPYLKGISHRIKLLNAFFLTDESYAVSYTYFQNNPPSPWYFLGSGFNIYLFWGGAGLAGYFGGNIIPLQWSYAFDFAFVAAFIGMLVPMVKDFPVVVTVIVASFLSVLGCLFIPGKWYILIAALGASIAGYLAETFREKRLSSTCREVAKSGS
ncbi:AzlC family ABC transporter permease [Candidatus Formimonas warabiya]|uniref:AzlC family ABC transporter permease n=1 Tax=Formimonas warabiya TaxID=1761012 RepID=A0A3G1KTJ0_FORW1|nr:AzlC family ABC transporter permease [Candidatus Formimonas warabiya]ATW25714.1 hypothetical protein DCMF_13920 [Candidatus Formimonas warabiya]